MGNKFILVFEDVEELPANTGNNPGLYITRQGDSSFLKFIPKDVRERPSCMEINSEELDLLIRKGLKEGERIETSIPGNSEPKEKPIKIETPKCEWVSAETLIKVVELLAKK